MEREGNAVEDIRSFGSLSWFLDNRPDGNKRKKNYR